jgi:two-component system, chemotaxis family, CheB/CheR fusion protein
MPRSAVATGCVDFVLSPTAIAYELARVATHPVVADDRASATTSDVNPYRHAAAALTPGSMTPILRLLRNHAGVDFSLYKASTVHRRIARRMIVTKQRTPEDYAAFLRDTPHELDALFQDALISVTSFFRNAEAFDVLRHTVFPALLQRRRNDPIRVWVPGCSTGQEAYSIAMAFMEAAQTTPEVRTLQVFATDVNDTLLDTARQGLYPRSVAQDLSPERLRRFFVEESGGYRVTKALRDLVIFARQNVISDPPFSRMDLISCRNLLIYFEAALQQKVFPVFHYALRAGGFLYLGASESIGGFMELFEPVDKKHKIYVKKAVPTPAFEQPPRSRPGGSRAVAPKAPGDPLDRAADTALDGLHSGLDAQREADRITVHRLAPPAVLVSDDLQILQFRGPTGAYLEPPTGKATLHVLKMARAGLATPLRAALNKARKDNETVRTPAIPIECDGMPRALHMEVVPLRNLHDRCFLIVFQEAGGERPASAAPTAAAGASRVRGAAARRVVALERELAETRDYLRAVQEQHDAANDELQTSNEEGQSANEELQSINEELETSKEELEATNEELSTVNDEMSHRNAELGRLNSDLVNVQASAHMAIVLLGRDLTVRRFSAQAEKRFNLLAADVGRPMSQIQHDVVLPDLEAFITGVIEAVRPREVEVQDTQGRWFSLRVRPYVTIDNVVDGAVLVLIDIDDLKRSAQRLITARDYVANIIETVRDPLVVLDGTLRVEGVNRAFRQMFQVGDVDTDGKFIYDLGDRQWDIPELRTLLSEILPQHTTVENFLVERDFVRLGYRSMLLNARRMRNADGATERIILAVEDITARKQVEGEVLRQTDRIETILNAVPLGVYLVDQDLRIRHVNPSTMHIFGNIPDLIGRDFSDVMHRLWPRAYADEVVGRFRQTLATGEAYVTPDRIEKRLDGGVTEYYEWQIHRISLPEGGFGAVCYFRDVSLEVKTRAALAESDRHKDEFLAMLAHELRNPLAPILVSIDVIRRAKANSPALVDQALDLIRRQVGHMVRLVDDLLDVGRVSRGRIDLRRERVELVSAIRQVVEGTRALFDRREQTLVVDLPAEPVFLSVDPVRLAQIVGNLLNNANKFTARGGQVWLTVDVRPGAALAGADGPQAVIRVRDTGIGIAAEHLTSVFDMFTQVDTSLERASTGLGIGLTLVKTLTEMHGGSVTASSRGLGQGSEFLVRLPIEVSREVPVVPPPAPDAAVAPLRILVVDDNHDAADSLAMLLTMNGHETHTEHDGVAAVAAVATFRPDVILMDIGLPGLNGYEAARQIRAQHTGPTRPVLVAVTGWGQSEDRQRSKDAGFDVHVVKPMDDVTLGRMLAEYGAARRGV